MNQNRGLEWVFCSLFSGSMLLMLVCSKKLFLVLLRVEKKSYLILIQQLAASPDDLKVRSADYLAEHGIEFQGGKEVGNTCAVFVRIIIIIIIIIIIVIIIIIIMIIILIIIILIMIIVTIKRTLVI